MDRTLLEKTIKRLEEKELVDHEVMEPADLEDLRNNIAELKKFVPNNTPTEYDVTVRYIEVFKTTIRANNPQHAQDLACSLFINGDLDVTAHHLEATID